MSIRVMSRVWDYSEQVGGDLLLLLALADFADDDGYCWPKQDQLAAKARCSVRAVRDQLVRLTAAGEIERSDGRGRGVGSTYRVLTGMAESGKAAGVAAFAADKKRQVEARKAAIRRTNNRQVATEKPATLCRPIENHQEPSSRPVNDPPEEEGSRAPVHTRPTPKPGPMKATAPSPSSVIDPNDEMQAAFLEGCGLDPELTRSSVLISVADYAGRLRRRKFTAAEIREAAATWHESLGPDRDPDSIEPPRPQQLAEWVARRKASEAMRRKTTGRPDQKSKPGWVGHMLVPMIER